MGSSYQVTESRAKSTIRRKVKSGCRTCKIRRVKCDEGKPVCSRCRTTGRTCDGYGIWGGGGNGYDERYGLRRQQNSSVVVVEKSLTANMGMEELRYLQLFRFRFIHTVSGWFGSDFWSKTVLPATSTEPTILHAVIALSAAHRCDFPSPIKPDRRERFMLEQYTRAINLLQSILHRKDSGSTTVVLITCQVFTFLEYLRGKPRMAETHLRNGLQLLKNMHIGNSGDDPELLVLKPSSHKVIDKGIVQRFATLHVQADLLGRRLTNFKFMLQPLETEIPFPIFFNAEEAKDSLDKLLHGILSLSQRIQEVPIKRQDIVSEFIRSKQQGLMLLAAWLETYRKTASEYGIRMFGVRRISTQKTIEGPLAFGTHALSNGVNAREPLAYRLILNYHTMASVMCNTLHLQGSEFKYKDFAFDFISILEGVIELWKVYSLARAIPGNVELSNSISEFGYIPPLYYTALKCRNRRIRFQAIRMLSQIHYKEAAWDSLLAANIARKVMQLEEGDLLLGDEKQDDEFPLDEIPAVSDCLVWTTPESNLFHNVQVEVSEESGSSALITCQRWRADGSLETVKCQVEGESRLAM